MNRPFYLLPDESIKPVSVGDGYKEYMLSDLMNGSDYHVIEIMVSPSQYLMPCRPLRSIFVSISLSCPDTTRGRFINICPICLCRKFDIGIDTDKLNCDDVLLRYIYDGDEVVNILWVSVFSKGVEVFSLV